MLNENFNKFFENTFFKNSNYDGVNDMITPEGKPLEKNPNASYGSFLSSTLSDTQLIKCNFQSTPYGRGFYLVFGKDIRANKTDYTMDDLITSGLKCNAVNKIITKNGISIVSSVTNESDVDISISAVGLVIQTNGSYNLTSIFLIGKYILEDMITLKPGQSKTFEYQIEF